MRRLNAPCTLAAALALCATGAAAQAPAPGLNDYPTEARADYVFACMAVNGQTRDALSRCSCSIDVVATIIPYERYVEAEAILRLRQVGGERTSIFRTAQPMREIVADLRRAQAEAEIRCFE